MGASAAAVAAIILFKWSGFALSLSACGGAILSAVLIYGLAWNNGVTPYRLVLIGIGISAMAGADRLVPVHPRPHHGSAGGAVLADRQPQRRDLRGADPARPRHAGALARWPPGCRARCAPCSWATTPPLRSARGWSGAASASSSSPCCSLPSPTSAVGPIAFVAFVAGPIARRLLGPAGNALLPSALVGALVTVAADFVAQHMLGRNQLPVGVVTGALGAVFLIYLLAAAHRSGQGG